jgi:hypothetical protein
VQTCGGINWFTFLCDAVVISINIKVVSGFILIIVGGIEDKIN